MIKAAAKHDAFDSEAYRTLFEGRIADPHAILGMHTEKDGIAVRVYDPVAEQIILIADGKRFPMEKVADAGLFVKTFPGKKKHFDYASRKAIPFISITGESERSSGRVNLKNLATGVQQDFACDDLDAMVSFLAG